MTADKLTPAERAALEKDIQDYEINTADGERWRYECRRCGKTPQDIGWCDYCGYNRLYDKISVVTVQ